MLSIHWNPDGTLKRGNTVGRHLLFTFFTNENAYGTVSAMIRKQFRHFFFELMEVKINYALAFRYISVRDKKFRCSGINVERMALVGNSFLPPLLRESVHENETVANDNDIWSDVDESILVQIAESVENSPV